MGTYEGLSIPIYGAFKHYTADQVLTWTVADSGAFDIAVTGTTTPDNAVAVTYTNATAVASGYGQAYYANLLLSSTTSGGNATQFNAFAADIYLAGTQACMIGGGYIYIYGSTAATLTSAAIYGFCLDIQSFESAPDYLVNLWLQRSNTQPAGAIDAYILFSGQTGAAIKSVFYFQGNTTSPSYFLEFGSPAVAGGAHGFYKTATKAAATSVAALSVKTSSTAILFIPLLAATDAGECSS